MPVTDSVPFKFELLNSEPIVLTCILCERPLHLRLPSDLSGNQYVLGHLDNIDCAIWHGESLEEVIELWLADTRKGEEQLRQEMITESSRA